MGILVLIVRIFSILLYLVGGQNQATIMNQISLSSFAALTKLRQESKPCNHVILSEAKDHLP
jgi:hypothetical protein